ncbi:hypothetical protein Ddye_011666 [Dipteronia dyeriana]|uniref:At2g29880-like C-terminal domain-containing protein n=1 Tax=Dipteronia dyeriana TaxID=168575 RepID=A0AAD9X2Y1_9ROSI|nr:hypothetical protein Ddye_011666 [Dipteronia dyeriana]
MGVNYLLNHMVVKEACYTHTEEYAIKDITRWNNNGVVEIDDDDDDSHEFHLTLKCLRNKTYDDYEDMQIVIGNAIATMKNLLGLSDETNAITFGVEDRYTILDDFVYDEANAAFVPNHNELSHQRPPLGQSSSHILFLATSSEVHPVSTSQNKRIRTDNERNSSSSKTNNQVGIVEKNSLSTDSIAAHFQEVHSLLEKREKDREKREKERQICTWDAIKETPNLDERARYKAIALLTNKTKKKHF